MIIVHNDHEINHTWWLGLQPKPKYAFTIMLLTKKKMGRTVLMPASVSDGNSCTMNDELLLLPSFYER